MNKPARQPDPAFIAAAVAIGCIGSLIALTVLGVFEMLPKWAAVLIVVSELLAPIIIYRVLKRNRQG